MHKIDINALNTTTNYSQLVAKCMDKDDLQVSFSYASDFRSAKTLRDIFEAICHIYHFDEMLTSRMTLVIDELNNNAIEYGSAL